MTEIKKIHKTTLAKIIGAIYGTLGFFISIILAALVGGNIVSRADFTGSAITVLLFHIGGGMLFGALTFFIAGAIGWVIGYIIASIYNFAAKKIGGVKIEIEESLD
ncbi:MAG: hypothetical protein WCW77_05720 [Patescibacteria group bacterium]|jgi:hypothetical protein